MPVLKMVSDKMHTVRPLLIDLGPKIRFLCYQKRPFLIRYFLIKFSDSPILLENHDFLTGWGYQKILLEKDFNSYRMTVSQL